jgi:hypothetical protein
LRCQFSSAIEPSPPGIDADDMARSAFGQFNDLVAFAAAKIHDHLAPNLVRDTAAQELFQLALVPVRARNTCRKPGVAVWAQRLENSNATRSADKSHYATSSVAERDREMQKPNRYRV